MRFGKARLYRNDIGILHKLQFLLFGLADPSHYLRCHYFKKFTNALKPDQILDAGCGRGDYTFYMAEYWPKSTIDSIDVDDGALERNVSVNNKMKFQNVSFRKTDLSDFNDKNKYDLIVCIDVIEHVVDQKRVLSNFFDALKKDGIVYLHIPLLNRPSGVPLGKYLSDFDKWAEHEHIGDKITRDEMLSLLKKSGFTILKEQYTFHYYYGEMACSLFNIFFGKSIINLFFQAMILPIGRLLCYFEMLKKIDNGFALAVLAQKK